MSPPRPAAQIRFWCIPDGSAALEPVIYLRSLLETGLGVRAVSITGLTFFVGKKHEDAGPWARFATAFTAPVARRYINVVCAPIGYIMGGRMAPKTRAQGDPIDSSEFIATPKSALSGLYTVGVPNVAITTPPAGDTEMPEMCGQALKQYDSVLSPTPADAERLRELGVHLACSVSPGDSAALKELMTALLPPAPGRA